MFNFNKGEEKRERETGKSENAKCRGVFRILSNILLAVTPIIVFEIVQMITVLSVRYKISQLRTARQVVARLFSMEVKYQLYNLVIYYALFAVMILIFRKAKVAAVVYTVALVTAALVNYYVIMFRGQPFMLLDIVGMGTAAEVVGEYQFRMPKLLALTMVAVLCFLVIQLIFQRFELGDKSARNRIMRWGVLGFVAIALWQSYPKIQKMENVLLWSVNSDHINKGYMYTLLRELRYFTVEKPEGYSADAVDAIAEKYTEDTEDTETVQADKETVQATNIIMIMNESLVDFEDVGDLKANKEILPYIRSMNKNVKHGQMHVPTFGGGTARSEYEALTGNSIQFLPSGSVPYQLYVRNPEYGMADILKAQGYQTIAMHPHKAANWNREKVYKSMGFDQFFSIENWGEEMDRLRNYCSDQSLYNRIVDLYNSKEKDQKDFIFCVTMQNHGGYTEERSAGYEPDVKLDYDGEYPLAEMYLSLARQSDEAFKNLIGYFEKVDEPTMIVMFGDHWPRLEEEFYSKVLGKNTAALSLTEKQKEYQTPYVIWTNYDSKTETEDFSSNYLGSYVLKLAGVELPAYNQTILKIREKLPIIGMGAYCDEEGNWYSEEELPKEYQDLVSEYKIMQYNDQFEKVDLRENLFRIGLK